MVKVKKNINKNANWKPVVLDGAVFNSDFGDLVGIEECLDYELPNFQDFKEDDSGSNNKKSKKNKNLKQKHDTILKLNEDHLILDEIANIISPSKKGCTSSLSETELSFDENDKIQDDESSMAAWDIFGLPSSILKSLKEQGFKEPTQIQALTLPAAIFGRKDILGAAETGSGKTLAFGLPILTGILKMKELIEEEEENDSNDSNTELISDEEENDKVVRNKKLYALILTPTRELAMQVKNHLTAAAKYTGINVAVIVGGLAAVKQERILKKGPEIVVATPGRLWELTQLGYSHLDQLNDLRFLVIDETDRMLERGHFHELHNILEKINLDREKQEKRQNFVFSATLTLVHDLPKHLMHKIKVKGNKKGLEMTPEQKLQKVVDMLGITDSKIVDVTKGTGLSQTLSECRITCGIEEKDYYVYYFLQKHPGRTLIFCNSIGCVKRLTNLLGLLGCNPLSLHASMQQRQRLKHLERFTSTEDAILIATDVAARGLDIPYIEHILHYQTPRTGETYIHRSGRTARARREGITVMLIEPAELQNYVKLCKTLEKTEDMPVFPVESNYLNSVKQRINLARELDKLELQVRKCNSETGWFNKAAQDMDLIVDHMSQRYDMDEMPKIRKTAEIKRKQLALLLAKPVFPKGFSGKFPLVSNGVPYQDNSNLVSQKAIDVLNIAIEKNIKLKKKSVPLYKPKGHNTKRGDRVIKLDKFKKNKKRNSNKRKK